MSVGCSAVPLRKILYRENARVRGRLVGTGRASVSNLPMGVIDVPYSSTVIKRYFRVSALVRNARNVVTFTLLYYFLLIVSKLMGLNWAFFK